MNRITFWIGLIVFIVGAFGLLVPPENYPAWYARFWGVTHPYKTDGVGTSAGVKSEIWTGRGIHGVGGDTSLQLDQPAFRQEAADADSRVDGRAQHRGYMAFLAMIGLLLMILGLRQEDNDRRDWQIWRLAGTPQSDEPRSEEDQDPPSYRAPLEPINDDPAPSWWDKLWAPFRRQPQARPATTSGEPVTIKVTVESEDSEGQVKAKHTLTAELPPMAVTSVEAHMRVGTNDTVQQMDLDVR